MDENLSTKISPSLSLSVSVCLTLATFVFPVFTVRCSLFAVHYSLFAIRCESLVAVRCSLFAAGRQSPIAAALLIANGGQLLGLSLCAFSNGSLATPNGMERRQQVKRAKQRRAALSLSLSPLADLQSTKPEIENANIKK